MVSVASMEALARADLGCSSRQLGDPSLASCRPAPQAGEPDAGRISRENNLHDGSEPLWRAAPLPAAIGGYQCFSRKRGFLRELSRVRRQGWAKRRGGGA